MFSAGDAPCVLTQSFVELPFSNTFYFINKTEFFDLSQENPNQNN